MVLGTAKFLGLSSTDTKQPLDGLFVNQDILNDANAAKLTVNKQFNLGGQTFSEPLGKLSDGGGFSVWVKHGQNKSFEIRSFYASGTGDPTDDLRPNTPMTWQFRYDIDDSGGSLARTLRIIVENSAAGQSTGTATLEEVDSNLIREGWNHYVFIKKATTTATGPSRIIYNGELYINGTQVNLTNEVTDIGQATAQYFIPLTDITFNGETGANDFNSPPSGDDSCFQQLLMYGTNFPASLRDSDSFINLGTDGTRNGTLTAPDVYVMFNHPFTDITTFEPNATLTLSTDSTITTINYDCTSQNP